MRTSSVDQTIIELLSHEHAHLTSNQVLDEIRGRLPAVNHSTIYRSLERLVDQGRVSVSDMGTGAAVYELVSLEKHHHLVCQKCGRVITIGDDDVLGFFTSLNEKHQFDIATNHLILFGTCSDCRQKDGASVV
jgi:Fur family transcriptional regulator, ferric uptake regulator